MSLAVRYYDEEGGRFCCALARVGRTKLHLTFIDDRGVRHVAVPIERFVTHTEPLGYHEGAYPVPRLVRRLRAVGRERGITEAAKVELKLAEVAL